MAASLAPTLLPNPVALWHGSIEGLSPHASPCRHLAPARWAALRESALHFLDGFGAEAARLGWTASQLFGVHAEHGTLRLDHCGALMVSGRRVVGIDAAGVRFATGTARRNGPGQMFGPPVWVFAKGEAGGLR